MVSWKKEFVLYRWRNLWGRWRALRGSLSSRGLYFILALLCVMLVWFCPLIDLFVARRIGSWASHE